LKPLPLSPLCLQLSPSPRLAAAIVSLHAAAGLCVVAVLPGAAGGLLAAALLALGAAAAWSRALLASASSVRVIELDGPGIAVKLASGERVVAELAERRYVTRFVVALPVRHPRGTVLVTRDMLAPDSFRALRLWALWGKVPGRAAEQLPA
jgi:hypothetical protein